MINAYVPHMAYFASLKKIAVTYMLANSSALSNGERMWL